MKNGRNGRNGSSNAAGYFGLGFIVIWLLMIAGWITNVINVISFAMSDTPLSEISVFGGLQIVGILVAPLGGFLGIYSWF